MRRQLSREEGDAYLADIREQWAAGKSVAQMAVRLQLSDGQVASIMRRHEIGRAARPASKPRAAGTRGKAAEAIRDDLSARAIEDWVLLDAIKRGLVVYSVSRCVFYRPQRAKSSVHLVDKFRVDRQVQRLVREGLVGEAEPGNTYTLTAAGLAWWQNDTRAGGPGS